MFDYFIHASNTDKTPYDINDIESGCGFDLNQFLLDQGQSEIFNKIIDIIENQDFTEFQSLVMYARQHHPSYLHLIIQRTYFSQNIWIQGVTCLIKMDIMYQDEKKPVSQLTLS